MPSSIFSSNPFARAPALRWRFLWPAALGLALAIIGSSEVVWRSQGHRPSIVDDPLLWSYHRGRVGGDPRQTVILGSSRIQLGFSTDVFRRRFPDRPLSVLTVGGRHPVAVLRDLAHQENFHGVVICSATAPSFSSLHWDDQQESVDRYHHRRVSDMIEPVLRCWVQNRLVVFHPNVRLTRLIRTGLTKRRLPEPRYLATHFDRSASADYRLLKIEPHREERLNHVRANGPFYRIDDQKWTADVVAIGKLVSRIQARGGKVVFVRFPTTGEHWELDQSRCPRNQYWDRLARLTGAVTIHFQDHPDLNRYELPDTSHLDFHDSSPFTEELLSLLGQRGVL